MQVQESKHGYKIVTLSVGKKESIPGDWEIKNLSMIADVIDPYPSHRAPPIDIDGIPYLGIGDFDETGKIINVSRRVNPKVLEEQKKLFQVYEGVVALGRVASIGKVVKLNPNQDYTVSPTLCIIIPKIDSNYLKQVLRSQFFQHQMNANVKGSTRHSVGIQTVRRLLIPIPHKKEQEKIASILSNVDSLIQQTDKVIIQIKHLKEGLMQKLLTQGISHTNFKEVKILRTRTYNFPNDWKVKNFGDCIKFLAGYSFSSKDYLQTGIQLLRQGNLQKRKLSLENDPVFLPESFVNDFNEYILKPNDIVISLTGTKTKRDYGYAVIIPGNTKSLFLNQRVAKIIPNSELVPQFLLYLMNHKYFEDQFYRLEAGTKQANVSIHDVLKNKIVIPHIDEQNEIALILISIDSEINQKKKDKSKLEILKKGLMQKLLTGQIRVNTH